MAHQLRRCNDWFTELSTNLLNNLGLKGRPKPHADSRLDGKTIIVTGSNRGIGKYIATDLAERGARVIMAVRNVESGEKTRKDILAKISNKNGDIVIMRVDMSSIYSIEQFAQKVIQEEDRVDHLIQNAGLGTDDPTKTDDGFELTMAVNYYGIVYLTMKLLDKMLSTSSDPRVFLMSSLAHHEPKTLGCENLERTDYISSFNQYGRSKLAMMLFGRELIRRTYSKGLRVYIVDPGISPTEIFESAPPFQYIMFTAAYYLLCLRSVRRASNSMMLSVLSNKEMYDPQHIFFTDGNPKVSSSVATDDEEAKKLWEVTSKTLGLEQMGQF